MRRFDHSSKELRIQAGTHQVDATLRQNGSMVSASFMLFGEPASGSGSFNGNRLRLRLWDSQLYMNGAVDLRSGRAHGTVDGWPGSKWTAVRR